MAEILKKKRGRKPKGMMISNIKIDSVQKQIDVNSEDENLILHIPITANNLNENNEDMDVFMKGDNATKSEVKTEVRTEARTDVGTEMNYETSIVETEIKPFQINPSHSNMIRTHSLQIKPETKCWWCKNRFDSDGIGLPEDYWDGKFHCIGHFCSYNCCSAYNLDLNDENTSKRESLLHLMCYQTTKNTDRIIPAPNWLLLVDFGGILSIEDFRRNSIVNKKEWLLLKPPLISRQIQIEESYKFSKTKAVPIENINRMYSELENSELKIKRSKPLETSQMNLTNTMGLIKKKRARF
jgi:hypothetical protein